MSIETKMRTKRRYAHELHPHPGEFEDPPLAQAVPYLYSRAVGFDVSGTSWRAVPVEQRNDRLMQMIHAGQIALLADALLQGMTGDAAWQWANERGQGDNLGEWVYERAVRYGVDPEAIKPYECGPEPSRHDHFGAGDARGWRTVHRVEGLESECPDCCEPVTE